MEGENLSFPDCFFQYISPERMSRELHSLLPDRSIKPASVRVHIHKHKHTHTRAHRHTNVHTGQTHGTDVVKVEPEGNEILLTFTTQVTAEGMSAVASLTSAEGKNHPESQGLRLFPTLLLTLSFI